jgi:hypothetical protein
LKKARLPLGVLIHPFKDLSHLPVIQCSTIVRCAAPKPVFRIHDILVWIRIRIRGSMPLLLFEGTFFKDKSPKEVTKQEESRFFLPFLIDDLRIWIRNTVLNSSSVSDSGLAFIFKPDLNWVLLN